MEMVKRLSRLPATEHIFKNEKTFANFVDHQLQQNGPGATNILTPKFDQLGVNTLGPSRQGSSLSVGSRISNVSRLSRMSNTSRVSDLSGGQSQGKRLSTYEMGYK